MKHRWLVALVVSILVGPALLLMTAAADPGVTLIGVGAIPGDALDLSGLQGVICQRGGVAPVCIDQATLGGQGSALAYTGHDNVFLAVPDRGPFDGRTDVPYGDRFHFVHMTVNPSAPFPNITATLLATRFLTAEGNNGFVGDAYAFSDTKVGPLRFDPEGAVVGRDGTFFISDEYGPYIRQFNRQGHLIRRIPVPSKFLLAAFPAGNQSGDVDAAGNSLELYPNLNEFGRQANRGMEGLAITPDGRMLVGIMQNALLQDHGLILDVDGLPARRGLNNRILTLDLETGETHEYVYQMDGPALNQGRGVNDLLAVNDHEFLVIERDNRSKVPTPPNAVQTPNNKKIYKIDLNTPGLTDVSLLDSLPETTLGSIVPVSKTLFIDLLNSAYVVDGTTAPATTVKDVIAEKVEAMAWGPDLPDGRHVLYVMTDNDLYTGYAPPTPARPTQIYAFAIGAAAHINYQPQQLPEPLFPPGQVQKALR